MLGDEGAAVVEDHESGGLVDHEDVLPAERVADVEDRAAGLDRPVRVDGRHPDPVADAAVRGGRGGGGWCGFCSTGLGRGGSALGVASQAAAA